MNKKKKKAQEFYCGTDWEFPLLGKGGFLGRVQTPLGFMNAEICSVDTVG